MKLFYSSLVLILLAGIYSCGPDSTGINVSGQPCTVKGSVATLDTALTTAYGFEPVQGAQVSLNGTAFTAVTDKKGEFQIDGIPEGQYDILYSKTGYGENKMMRTPIRPGASDFYNVLLGREPSALVHLDSIVPDTEGFSSTVDPFFHIDGTASSAIPVEVFIDLDSNHQSADSHLRAYEIVLPAINWTFLFQPSALHLEKGTTIYITAAAVNARAGVYYMDPLDQDARFVSVGMRSNVVSFVMP